MREIVLIKNGELALKGLNRSSFEDVLIKNMRRHLAPLGTFQCRQCLRLLRRCRFLQSTSCRSRR